MVSLALVIARIAQVLEVESLRNDGREDALRIGAHAQHSGNGGTYLQALLLLHLRAQLLGRVLGYGMGNLMTHDNRQ